MTYASFPLWLHVLSISRLSMGLVCAVVIALDQLRRPQKMWIMYLVWTLTALFGSALWLAAYYAWGRGAPGGAEDGEKQLPFAAMVFKGASHCGAGCTLGDILVEWAAFAWPGIAIWFGWHGLFEDKMFAVWVPDFLVAFLLGILFQYFTIKPMRDLSPAQGVLAAVKADIASITAWQVGMYGLMAAIQLGWFRPVYGGVASVASPEFWFAMQVAMLGGFATGYPVNWMLIRAGLKEKM